MITLISISAGYSYASDAKQPALESGSTIPPPVETQLLTPESLTLKYKPDVSKTFKPFLGTGIAYSIKTQETNVESKKEMKAGVGANAGFGLLLGKNSSLNFDYKYLYLTPDVKRVHDGATPHQIGIGFDMKF
jgi:outer membrane protein W